MAVGVMYIVVPRLLSELDIVIVAKYRHIVIASHVNHSHRLLMTVRVVLTL
jgi:hypothetical protein